MITYWDVHRSKSPFLPRYETPIFQKKVKNIYEALQEKPLWHIVDADKTEEDLNQELMSIVIEKIDNLELETPAKMW